MKKTLPICILLCLLFASPKITLANEIPSQISTTSESISPYSDIIEWRYKAVNGKLYKRLYNYSKGKWIGEWILVP